MSEFIKGAVYARDSILGLIKELQGAAADKYAPFSVKPAQKSLQRVYNEISDVHGWFGSEDFLGLGPVSHTSFQNGAEYGKNRISSLVVLLQGEIGHAHKFLSEYQALQWLLNSIDEKCAVWKNELKEKARESLAVKLNNFYKDFDLYDYVDKLDGTEQDAIESLVGQLGDPAAVKGIVDVLADIKENSQLSDAERQELDDLISNLSKVLDSLISVKSFDTILRAAQEKSSLADDNNAVVCKENCDYGK